MSDQQDGSVPGMLLSQCLFGRRSAKWADNSLVGGLARGRLAGEYGQGDEQNMSDITDSVTNGPDAIACRRRYLEKEIQAPGKAVHLQCKDIGRKPLGLLRRFAQFCSEDRIASQHGRLCHRRQAHSHRLRVP
jgi:hypothetical protein